MTEDEELEPRRRDPSEQPESDRWKNDTYEQRIRRVERRLRLVSIVGTSLTLFLVVLLSGDAASNVYNTVPDSLRAAIFTLLVLTGASIASAYIRYERELFRLRWLVDHDPPYEAERPGARWPNDAEAFWIGGLILFLVTAVTFVAACWVPAFT